MPGPRVLLDATAVPADRGGVGRYVDALLGALAAMGRDPVVVCQERDAEVMSALGVREVVLAPAGTASRARRLVWEQSALPGLVDRLGADVLHSPHYTTPARLRAARVVTLHDATFFTDPAVHQPVKALTFRAATRRAVAGAERCVVPSEATRTEGVRLTGADPDRVDVALHGVDAGFFHPPAAADRARVAASLGLGERPWIAFLATIEPRKNVGNLVMGWVRAFAALHRDDPVAVPALVLAGGQGWDAALPAVLAQVPAGMPLLLPGYLPYEDLPGFLGGAELVAYPSLGEGFGLPVLEAMATGSAVLTTRLLSLPEVGGDAVAYCQPDGRSIATSLQRLHEDRAGREALGRAARERALGFTWAASAQVHLRAWELAAGARR
jgi:glycosyltransferase involved in cell wall biosynthesis